MGEWTYFTVKATTKTNNHISIKKLIKCVVGNAECIIVDNSHVDFALTHHDVNVSLEDSGFKVLALLSNIKILLAKNTVDSTITVSHLSI